MKKLIAILASVIAIALLATGCTSVVAEYSKVKYDSTGTVVIETEHYTKTEKGFTQGWSNGEGKTVDVHPQFDLLNF